MKKTNIAILYDRYPVDNYRNIFTKKDTSIIQSKIIYFKKIIGCTY